MYNFKYLTEKIANAEIRKFPFDHIYIENFFSNEHFEELVKCSQIDLKESKDDRDLIDRILSSGYKIISFPGCITNKEEYLKWHKDKKVSHLQSTSNEGFGMVFRLTTFQHPLLSSINEYLIGPEFNQIIADKFKIDINLCNADAGIQKYLDGYEISPHPDIRKKATTFMVNINPGEETELIDYHTHYMKFVNDFKYVEEFWKNNKEVDRCWVPWNWCETVFRQTENNSIVIFSPSDSTLHAVKATYNHLLTQRTQLYGNLWYKESLTKSTPKWEYFNEIKNNNK
jgi:hypothetical protein